MHRLLKRHIDGGKQLTFQHPIDIVRHAAGRGGAMADQHGTAVRINLLALAEATALLQKQTQVDDFRRWALDVEDFIDFAA
ncbi:hypothetical protein D3C75_1151070 [compost metagenome]